MLKKNEEIWKDIPGYEMKYQASTLGRLRSLDRTVFIKDKNGINYKRFMPGVLLKQQIGKKTGYKNISINGGKHRYDVHRLIAMTFLGDISGSCINHINFIRTDNRLENLEVVNQKQNCIHSLSNGRHNKAKLKKEDVVYIRNNYLRNKNTRHLALKFNISVSAVRSVVRRATWKFID